MISDERIVAFINSLEKNDDEFLIDLRNEAQNEGIPIIRKEMESFLRVLFSIKKPIKVLELGSAIGYSAILMSRCLGDNGHITTIENYDKRIVRAKENFIKSGEDKKITLIEGDALDEIKKLSDGFDFIFVDAAKAQYINYLPELIRLLNTGGIMITDNVLQDGDIFESRYGIIRRNRTIHSRMREYLEAVKNSDSLETTIVPIGDGVTLSVRK